MEQIAGLVTALVWLLVVAAVEIARIEGVPPQQDLRPESEPTMGSGQG